MIKIKPIFSTFVKYDVYNPDGSLWLPKNSKVYHSSIFETKKFKNFLLVTPNPVHLIISGIDFLISEIQKEITLINQNNKIIVFSKLLDGRKNFTVQELIELDKEAKVIRKLDEDRLYKYLFLSMNCIISMISAIEAFVNQEIPVDFFLYKKKNKKVFKKEDIEKELTLKEKIKILAKILNKKEYHKFNFWYDFLEIKEIRDDLIHLKTKGSISVERYNGIFSKIFDLDFLKYRNSIVSMINYFKEKYIE